MNHRLRKRLLSFSMQMLAVCGTVQTNAQTTATGPSTLQSPYVLPLQQGYKITSILSANDSIGGYPMCGTPDGLGVFDNGDGTFTLLMNHEFVNTVGGVRAHGSKGSFVSKWVIKKSDLTVQSGSDLIQNVKLWNGTGYDTYNAGNPSTLAAFSRFCSADLPPVSAFYNSLTGNGTQERIFMNGEEVSEGRAMAHIVTGANAGTSYQLPLQGKMAFENQVANGHVSDITIVGCMDDASITTGNVYFYIGTKTNTGTEIDKAGLTNGKLYGVKVTGFPQERTSSSSINNPPAAGTHFDLVDLGDVTNLTGAQLDAASATAGATYFSRPEDGAWDPSNLNDFYFNTTDQIDQVNDNAGTQVGHSRVWKLHFTDLEHPELGGTIEAVIDGTEGINMLDNMTIDKYDHITLLEDVGNSAHNGKVWQYDIKTDALKMIGKHDPARFGDIGVAATSPYNQDEETSGVIDVQEVLGPGMYLIVDQAHYTTGIPSDIVEGGQLLAIYNADTYRSYVTSQGAGPNTLQTPYLVPVDSKVKFTSILSANDSVGTYHMAGTPDGLGAFDNNDGTFTLLMNHEFISTVGDIRAHGSKGAFVSKWIINKSDLSVISGSDLMQNVNLWNGTGYDTYNAGNPSALAAFNRFCSADLPPISAFYNSATGNGTQERIYMNGEEVSEGRAMAHIVTGANAGTSYQLPLQGKMAFENQVANGHASDVTIVGCMDDASITTGNVYFYVGTKTNTGTEIDKAGLTNGKLYGVKITGFPQERTSSSSINNPPAAGTHFDLVDLGAISNLTGAQLDAASATAGATYFSRPEDGAWDPSNLNDFYFNTTDQIDQVNDNVGTQVGHSRLWRLRFTDLEHPELGGTVEAVLDGTEGQNMLDNLTIDNFSHIIELEDVGNSAHNGKVWQYDIKTDSFRIIAKHDPARFGDIGVAATAPFNQDEETSGVIDVQSILGPGMYLIVDQAHYTTGIPSGIVEGGQLLAMFDCPSSASFDTVTACGSYSWNGQTYNSSGTYTYTTTNTAGCDSVATLVLTVNPAPVADTSTTPILCSGGLSTVTINVTGGTAPFQYQLNQRKTQSSNVFADLRAKTYQFTVYDAKSCSDTISVTIKEPAKLKLVLIEKVRPSCKGGSDGDIIVTATGGAGDYTYSINGGEYSASGIYGVFNGLSAGPVTISVKDANGCVFQASATLKDGVRPCAPGVIANNHVAEDSKLKAQVLTIKVLPNPSATTFTLIAQSNSTDELQLTVTDAYGKNVYSTKGAAAKQYSFGNNFASGIYFVRVVQGKNVQTIKVIKGKE